MQLVGLNAMKGMFFDRAGVQRAVDAATRRVLSRFGAFVMTRSRTSIRTRKGISAPGSPPHSHTGLLRKGILFGYDTARQSVVVGPVVGRSGGIASRALEYGGSSVVRNRRGGSQPTRVKSRPFMQPALAAELPGLPAMWRDSVRKG
ncbi:MAG: hypothetical protein U0840_25665 [Gemmataceae bacterium]